MPHREGMINEAVHTALQRQERIALRDYPMRVLVQRSEMTGADRAWASRYQVGDVLHYQRGSAEIDIPGGSYAHVVGHEWQGKLHHR
jgi:hypothetical protein